MVRDPALLIWLDAPANRKGKPNENLGRELMEVFTLGIPVKYPSREWDVLPDDERLTVDVKTLAVPVSSWRTGAPSRSSHASAASKRSQTSRCNTASPSGHCSRKSSKLR